MAGQWVVVALELRKEHVNPQDYLTVLEQFSEPILRIDSVANQNFCTFNQPRFIQEHLA